MSDFMTERQASHIGKLIVDFLTSGRQEFSSSLVQEVFQSGPATKVILTKVANLLRDVTIGRYDLEYPDCRAKIRLEGPISSHHYFVITPTKNGEEESFPSVTSAIADCMRQGRNWAVEDVPSIRHLPDPMECFNCHKNFTPQSFEVKGDEICPFCGHDHSSLVACSLC